MAQVEVSREVLQDVQNAIKNFQIDIEKIVQNLEKSSQKVKNECEELIEKQNNDVKILENDVLPHTKEIKNLENDIKVKNNQVVELKNQVSSIEIQINQINNTIIQLESQKRQLESEVSRTEDDGQRQNLLSQISNLQSRIYMYNTQKNNLLQERRQYRINIDKLEHAIEQQRNSLSQKNIELEKNKKGITLCTIDIESLRRERESLIKRIAEIDQMIISAE